MFLPDLDTDIKFMKGVGEKRAAALASELDVHTVGDLIRTYPFRYIDRSGFQNIGDLIPSDTSFIQLKATVIQTSLLSKAEAWSAKRTVQRRGRTPRR